MLGTGRQQPYEVSQPWPSTSGLFGRDIASVLFITKLYDFSDIINKTVPVLASTR